MKRFIYLFIFLILLATVFWSLTKASLFETKQVARKRSDWFSTALHKMGEQAASQNDLNTGGTDLPVNRSASVGSITVSRSRDSTTQDSSQASNIGESSLQFSTSDTENDEVCWKKIESEITNPDFFEYNRDYLNRRIGVWIFPEEKLSVDFEPQSLGGKFFLALGRVNLLTGKKIPPDLNRGLALLYELIDEDPGNSAPILFAALVEEKLNHREEFNKLIAKANASTHFNSYISETMRSVYSRVRSSADYIQAIAAWSLVPIPEYQALKKILETQGLKNVAEQLVRSPIDPKNTFVDLDWSVVEYAVGRAILKKMTPGFSLPAVKDLIDTKNEMTGGRPDKILSAMRKNCSLSSIDPFTKQLQEHVQDRKY